MIEIIETRIVNDKRVAVIAISNGGGQIYLWDVPGLPLEGDLQTILNAREAELWAGAQIDARTVDLYELTLKRVLKAFALVILDENNRLTQKINQLCNIAGVPTLPLRTAGQIDDAIKAKLKAM